MILVPYYVTSQYKLIFCKYIWLQNSGQDQSLSLLLTESNHDMEKSLLELLELEQLEYNLFRGDSRDIGSINVFGGQVLGQALYAAIQTMEEPKYVHSLHAYFLLPGDMSVPIIYDVERIRNGRSFSTRRVVAIQHGKPIFNLAASFQIIEEGCDHQIPRPETMDVQEMIDLDEIRQKFLQVAPEKMQRFLSKEWPIEIHVEPDNIPYFAGKKPPRRDVFFKAKSEMPDNGEFQKCVLAYASDFNLLSTALLPHNISFPTPDIKLASLDHAMWFHRPFDMNDWLLYNIESPSASNARGFSMGHIFNREGHLVATVCQEGLMRMKK